MVTGPTLAEATGAFANDHKATNGEYRQHAEQRKDERVERRSNSAMDQSCERTDDGKN
jgi:hypothetical protein